MSRRERWPTLHRVLQRQLAKAGVLGPDDPAPGPVAWAELVERLHRGYVEADNDRYTLERSLDISSVEMAELHERLEEEHERLRSVLKAVPFCVLQIDASGSIRFVNAAAEALLSDARVGSRLFDRIALAHASGEVFDPLHLERAKSPIVEPDGEMIVGGAGVAVAWHLAPSGAASDQMWVLTITDLRAQKRSEQEAREARVEAEVARRSEKARGQFLANMSHELRTPMNAILGYTEILMEEWAHDNALAHVDLDRVLNAGRHLLGLINDILDLSKIDAGRMDLNIEAFDLNAQLHDIVAATRVLAEKNRNRLVLRVEPGVEVMSSDVTKLRQCLFNLVSNAAKFTTEGTISVLARREGTLYAISVVDTGVGIPLDQQHRLFEPFGQADAATTKAYGGTGLGLTLTRAFTELLGGSVTFESLPGQGTTFTLRLPVQWEPATRLDATGEVWTRGSGVETVLVVDDDPAVFDLIARLVARDGVRVVGVPTAEQAMATALDVKPAVVILDIWLPGVNGWMALRAFRGDERTRTLPVVVVTTSDEGRRLAMELHADAFMTKPLDRHALLELLRRFVRTSPHRRTPDFTPIGATPRPPPTAD